MEEPHQYPYHPPVWAILLSFGTGVLWMAIEWFPWEHIPTGLHLWDLGLIPIAWSFILAGRRILGESYLLLDYDRMVLPTGLFGMRTAKIEYTSIRRVWRHYIRPYECTFALKVATEEQAFDILPAYLPDSESRRAVEEFLNQKLLENMRAEKFPRNEWA